jgi:hypothetical protein
MHETIASGVVIRSRGTGQISVPSSVMWGWSDDLFTRVLSSEILSHRMRSTGLARDKSASGFERVTSLVAAFYGIAEEELSGPNRERLQERARQMLFLLAKRHCGPSAVQIGARLGGRREAEVEAAAERETPGLVPELAELSAEAARLLAPPPPRCSPPIAPPREEKRAPGEAEMPAAARALARPLGLLIRSFAVPRIISQSQRDEAFRAVIAHHARLAKALQAEAAALQQGDQRNGR